LAEEAEWKLQWVQLVVGKGPKAAADSLRQLKANCPAERSQSKEDAPPDYNSRG